MKVKLKARSYTDPIQYEMTVDFREMKKRAEMFLTERRADKLAFDLMELDEACETFRQDLRKLFKALHAARSDSTDLYDISYDVLGDFHHFRGHIRSAFPALQQLGMKARELPPIASATDEQLSERARAPFDKFFEAAGIRKTSKGKKTKKSAKKRSATTKTKKKPRKKT